MIKPTVVECLHYSVDHNVFVMVYTVVLNQGSEATKDEGKKKIKL